jgi:3-isopropylmalate/(R)-2-methylmalate dehydratase small subunit
MNLVRTGRVWLFGDNINTDLIMPGKALALPRAQQHTLAFEAVRPGWSKAVQPGDLIVAGRNFGMGSSRPIDSVLRACGIAGIVAESVNGLCLRTLVNGGIPAIDCAGAASLFREGDIATVDFTAALVRNDGSGATAQGRPLAPLLADIIAAGGVMQMLIREGYVEKEAFTAASA